MTFIEVKPSEPCPICNKPDWCRRDYETGIIECHRIAEGSTSTTRGGFYIHRIADISNTTPTTLPPQPPSHPKTERLPTSELHEINAYFYDQLTLSDAHYTYLRKERGYSDRLIEHLGYRSAPVKDRGEVLSLLQKEYGTSKLKHVPGFYSTLTGLKLLCGSGILLPCYDISDRIQGFQIRYTDEDLPNGNKYRWLSSKVCSTGTPIHLAKGVDETVNEVWITEGILKADVTSYLLGLSVIGIAGVNAWEDKKEFLDQTLSTLGAKVIVIALDADFSDPKKPNVAGAIDKLYAYLSKSYEIKVACWHEKDGKGIDDLFLSDKKPLLLEARYAPSIQMQIELACKDEKSDKGLVLRNIIPRLAELEPIDCEDYISLLTKKGYEFTTKSALRNSLKPLISDKNARIRSEKTRQRHKDKANQVTEDSLIKQGKFEEEHEVDEDGNTVHRLILSRIIDNSYGTAVRDTFSDAAIRAQLLSNMKLYFKDQIFTDEQHENVFFIDLVTKKLLRQTERQFISNAKRSTKAYDWSKPDPTGSRALILTSAPQKLEPYARDLFYDQKAISSLPVIKGQVNHPIITLEGAVTKTGYDKKSQYYVTDSPDIDYESLDISDTNIEAQKEILLKAVSGTTFKDFGVDRSNWFAYTSTLLMRPYFGESNIPIYVVTAAAMGTGKSFLIEVTDYLLDGKRYPVRQLPNNKRNPEEAEKRINSALLDNPERIKYDDVDGLIDHAILSEITTTHEYIGRELGHTRDITVVVNAVFSITGNNIEFGGGLPRRIYTTTLTSDQERPELTVRAINAQQLIKQIQEDRFGEATWLKAWFTCYKGYIASGGSKVHMNKEPKLGSFDVWENELSGFLNYLGLEGFLDDKIDIVDRVIIDMRAFLETVYEELSEEDSSERIQFAAGEVMSIASHIGDDPENGQNLLRLHLGAGNQHSRTIRLSRFLRENKERPFGSKILRVIDNPETVKDRLKPFYIEHKEEIIIDDRELDRAIMSILAQAQGSMTDSILLEALHEEGYKITKLKMEERLSPFIKENMISYDGDTYQVL